MQIIIIIIYYYHYDYYYLCEHARDKRSPLGIG